MSRDAQDGHAIGDALDLVQVVRRDHHLPRSLAQPQDERARFVRAFRIEPGGRLVEQHDRWIVQQRARKRDPLFQSLRELRRRIAGAVGDAEEIERAR